MKDEFDAALCRDFPSLYRNRGADMRTTAMCWGMECGEGWANILRALSAGLTKVTENHASGSAAKAADHHFECGFEIVADQVKEKFGTLRFYFHSESKPDVQPEEVDGDYAKQIEAEIDGMVEMAERMSAVTCEACGRPGVMRGHGWYFVACEEHARDEKSTSENEDE